MCSVGERLAAVCSRLSPYAQIDDSGRDIWKTLENRHGFHDSLESK